MRIATQRLIDASAKLAADDRALLNLLIHHGLDDTALANLTNSGPVEIAARRKLLVERLGAELELSATIVKTALDDLAGTAREHRAAPPPAALDGPPTSLGSPVPEPPPTAPTSPPGVSQPRRRRRGLLALLVLAVVVVVVLVIALAAGGKNNRPAAKHHPPAANGQSHPSASSVTARAPLTAFPGGPPGVGGTLALKGANAHPRLLLTVSGLPSPGDGSYEVWLYNSIIDSVPLGPLASPGSTITIALPSDYRRYQWLDISRQPAGAVVHSGESILRAPVPH